MGKPHPVRRVAAALGAGRARDRVITLLGGHPARSEQELPGGPKGAPSLPPVYVGSTRFSLLLPESRDWRLTRQTGATDPEEYANHLYSEERMGPRCDIFCELAAPIYQRMAERHDYRHLVRYSPEMPDPWRTELLEAAERHPVLYLLDSSNPTRVDDTIGSLLREDGRRSRPVLQFRLDDDDLLATDFLDRMSRYATPHDRGRAVSMASGYAALYDGGTLGPVRDVRRVFGAQGLAYVGHYDAGADTLQLDAGGAHYIVDRKMPAIVDSREPAFFQMRHTGQDMLTDADEAVRTINQELGKRPVVKDVAAVVRRFPTLKDLLEP